MGKLNLTIDLDNLSQEERQHFFKLVKKSKKSFNPFERVELRDIYYYINENDKINADKDCKGDNDNYRFNIHNYFNDKEFAEHQALRELLNRKLIKFSYENGGADIDFSTNMNKWEVYYNNDCGLFITALLTNADILTPVFISEEVAQRAINEVIKPFLKEHPNFKWWG